MKRDALVTYVWLLDKTLMIDPIISLHQASRILYWHLVYNNSMILHAHATFVWHPETIHLISRTLQVLLHLEKLRLQACIKISTDHLQSVLKTLAILRVMSMMKGVIVTCVELLEMIHMTDLKEILRKGTTIIHYANAICAWLLVKVLMISQIQFKFFVKHLVEKHLPQVVSNLILGHYLTVHKTHVILKRRFTKKDVIVTCVEPLEMIHSTDHLQIA